jgi:predicted component of type VI protein secretion system
VTFVKDGIANIELLLEQLQQYQASAYSADHADAACEISQTCEEIEKISQAVEKFEPDLNLTFASGSSASLDSGNFWIRLIERLNHTEGIYLPLRKILEEFIASVGKEEELLSGKVGDLQSEIVGLEEEFCSLIQEKFDYFSESNVLRFVEKENYANMAKSKQLEYEEIIEQYRRINPKLAQYIEMQVKSEAFQEVIDDIQNECGVFSPESDGTDLNADVIQNVELLERQTHQEQICTDRLYQQAFSMISKSDALENGLFQKVQSSFADAQFVQSEENSKLSLIQKNLRNILNKKELDKSMRQKFISSEFQIDSSKLKCF